MSGAVRLSGEARAEVEEFFRAHLGDSEFSLPEITVHAGTFSRLLMKAVGMGAITFGRHVFVNPSFLKRESGGRASVPGWLLVHEAAHVLQYEERGYARFFRDYLRNYWRALRAGKSWDAAARERRDG